MIFTADTPHSYACLPYRLHWSSRGGWSAYKWVGLKQVCLGEDLTCSEAMRAAEDDQRIEFKAMKEGK